MRYVMQEHVVADRSRLCVETIDVFDKNKNNLAPGAFLSAHNNLSMAISIVSPLTRAPKKLLKFC